MYAVGALVGADDVGARWESHWRRSTIGKISLRTGVGELVVGAQVGVDDSGDAVGTLVVGIEDEGAAVGGALPQTPPYSMLQVSHTTSE